MTSAIPVHGLLFTSNIMIYNNLLECSFFIYINVQKILNFQRSLNVLKIYKNYNLTIKKIIFMVLI